MVNQLLMKFIIFYAILSVFLAAFGAGSITGWGGFQTAISTNPASAIPGSATLVAALNSADYFFTNNTWQTEDVDYGNIACPQSELNFAPVGYEAIPLAVNDTSNSHRWATSAEMKDATFDAGNWSIQMRLHVGNVTTRSTTVQVRIQLTWVTVSKKPPGAGVLTKQKCTSWGTFLQGDSTNLSRGTYPLVYINQTLGSVTCSCGGAASLLNGGAVYMQANVLRITGNQTVTLNTTAESFIVKPHASVTQPGALENIANFFSNIIAWIVWGLSAFASFFVAIFLLNVPAIFGPFGVFMVVLNIVFLAYVFMTIIYWIRGTSGSLGV